MTTDTLWHCLAGDGSGFVSVSGMTPTEGVTLWSKADNRKRLMRLLEAKGLKEAKVSPIPSLYDESARYPTKGSCLWAHTDTGASLRLLEAFPVRPTIWLGEGDSVRSTALWCLHTPLSVEWIERANRRLSLALDTTRRTAQYGFTFFLPGQVVHEGTRREFKIEVLSQSEGLYSASDVVGHLRDAPAPDSWVVHKRIQELRSAA
jgi:hypothetical protein